MFCKNCGREIDQKTLKKLMENTGEPVVCSKCKQPLDNAEICGGFWGLIASAKEKEAEDLRAGGTTLMLDENGRPVQMGAPVQKRPAPAAAEADRERARTGFSNEAAPQNSGEYRGAERSASSYSRNESGIQPRRSGARKNNTELWITRVIAILLGICLIISLIRGCGHDEKRLAPDNTAGINTTGKENEEEDPLQENPEENADESDSANTGVGNQGAFSGKTQDTGGTDQDNSIGADQGENGENNETGPSDKGRKKKKIEKGDSSDSAEGNGLTDSDSDNVESENDNNDNAGDLSTPGNADESGTGSADKENSVGSYSSIVDTIGVDVYGWNHLTKRQYLNDEGLSYEWYYVDDAQNETLLSDYINTNRSLSGGTVKKYRKDQNSTKEYLCSYEYSGGYLENVKNDSKRSGIVEYRAIDAAKVLEIYHEPVSFVAPDGETFDCGSIIKTYDTAGSFKRLVKIEYYKDSESEEPIDSAYAVINYKYDDDKDNGIYSETYEDAEGKAITIEGNGYKYDKICYTYKPEGDRSEVFLSSIEYYLGDKRAKGPNGFSVLEYEHQFEPGIEPGTKVDLRTASFKDANWKRVEKLTCEEPLLSNTVIPGYYAEEYPYLMGRPGNSSVNDSSDSHQNRENGSSGALDYDGSIKYQ